MSCGDVLELANLFAEVEKLEANIRKGIIMPEKLKCECGCEFFTNNIYQLKLNGEVLVSKDDWFACLKCGKVYHAKNNKVAEVKE